MLCWSLEICVTYRWCSKLLLSNFSSIQRKFDRIVLARNSLVCLLSWYQSGVNELFVRTCLKSFSWHWNHVWGRKHFTGYVFWSEFERSINARENSNMHTCVCIYIDSVYIDGSAEKQGFCVCGPQAGRTRHWCPRHRQEMEGLTWQGFSRKNAKSKKSRIENRHMALWSRFREMYIYTTTHILTVYNNTYDANIYIIVVNTAATKARNAGHRPQETSTQHLFWHPLAATLCRNMQKPRDEHHSSWFHC